MPVTVLAAATSEFHVALDILLAHSEFVDMSIRLRPRLGGIINWESLDKPTKAFVQQFLSAREAELSIYNRGLLIALSGAYEDFVRRVIVDCVRDINSRKKEFALLPETLRKQNIYRTGIALQTINEGIDQLSVDYHELGRNLATCVPGSTNSILNADSFAIFSATLSPDKLEKTFERIGISLNWDAIADSATLQTTLGKTGKRETSNSLKEFLTAFFKQRNRISHSGSAGIIMTQDEFATKTRVFRAFSTSMSAYVESCVRKA